MSDYQIKYKNISIGKHTINLILTNRSLVYLTNLK